MACDLPENYLKHPDAFRFIEHVPCDWERSLLVDGQIGAFCVFARQERSTDNWYIGGINGDETREVEIPLDFLGERQYTATIYRDGEHADWQTNPYDYLIEERTLCTYDTLRIHMCRGGGFAIELIIDN